VVSLVAFDAEAVQALPHRSIGEAPQLDRGIAASILAGCRQHVREGRAADLQSRSKGTGDLIGAS
jgi:hypothetical protein